MDNEIKFKKPQQPDPKVQLYNIVSQLQSCFDAVVKKHPAVLQHFHFTTPPISNDGDEPTTYMLMSEFTKHVVHVHYLLGLTLTETDPERIEVHLSVLGSIIDITNAGYATRVFMRVWSPTESLYYNVCLQPAPGYGWYVDDIIKEGESLKFLVQRQCYQSYLATRDQHVNHDLPVLGRGMTNPTFIIPDVPSNDAANKPILTLEVDNEAVQWHTQGDFADNPEDNPSTDKGEES